MVIISRDELQSLIENKQEYRLIDVRERDEMAYGKIPTSVNIPLSELTVAFELSPKQCEERYGVALKKGERIIFYCRSGSRSQRATDYARSLGFSAENFKGSILSWSEIDQDIQVY